MQDNLLILAPVTLIKRQNNLSENSPNKVLVYVLIASWHTTFLDKFAEVATLAILHDQIDRSILLVYEFIEAADNVFMLQLSQNVYLIDQLLLLLIIHATIVCLFPHHLLTRLNVSHQGHFSITSYNSKKHVSELTLVSIPYPKFSLRTL